MEKYISLLTEASNRASYRDRPVDTLKKVQRLANKSAEKREEDAKNKKIKFKESTPRQIAINEAVKRAGARAYKEATKEKNTALNKLLYTKSVMEQSGATPQEIRRINTEIDKLIGQQKKQEDLENLLEKYKDRPEIYLAKLQQAKLESEKEFVESLKEGQAKTQELISRTLPVQELLKSDPTYMNLKPKEKKYVLSLLQKSTPRDLPARKEAVRVFLESPEEERRILLSQLASEVPEPKTPQIKDVLKDKVLRKQKQDYLDRERYTDRKQKKYVKDKLFSDPDVDDALSIQMAIERYKTEYDDFKPKKTDIYFEQAEQDEAEQEEKQEAIVETLDESAKKEAEEEIKAEDAPNILDEADKPIIEAVAQELASEGNEDADEDAKVAVARSKVELDKQSESEESEEQETKPKIPFPGETTINKMTAQRMITFMNEHNIEPPASVIESLKKPRGGLTVARNYLKNLRAEQAKQKRRPKGSGFQPLLSHPPHLIAGSLSKHIDKVRQERFKTNLHKTNIFHDTDNEEYRKGLKQKILQGGGFFGDLFGRLSYNFLNLNPYFRKLTGGKSYDESQRLRREAEAKNMPIYTPKITNPTGYESFN